MRRTLIALAVAAVSILSIDAYATGLIIQPGITIDMPQGWTATRDTATTWLLQRSNQGHVDASMSITVEQRGDHAEATQQLAAIEAAYDATPTYRTVAGWPTLERKVQVPYPTPEENDRSDWAQRIEVPDDGNLVTWSAVTAVAAGDRLVRMQSILHPSADPSLADEALAMGRTLKLSQGDAAAADKDVLQLRSGSLRPEPVTANTYAKAEEKRDDTGTVTPVLLPTGLGELEAAVSANGQDIVTTGQCQTSRSINSGTSFSASTLSGVPAALPLDGDCSVTWGKSSNFYLGRLGGGIDGGSIQFVALYNSGNQGATFTYRALPVDRRSVQINVDQPHLAADRVNVTKSGDLLYVVWHETRHFLARVACSKSSGVTWGQPVDAHSGNLSYPRVAVGRDGMVYVVSRDGHNIVIDKFSRCGASSTLTEQRHFPVRLQIADVKCPVPGLDRCNDGNTLSSPVIATDDLIDSRLFLAFAQRNGSGNDDIAIIKSTDGGVTWDRPAAIANGRVAGVRFMPWIGVARSVVYAAWYDRRFATDSAPGRTSYYRNSVSLVDGTLTPGTEVKLNSVDDAQCGSGWPCGTRASADSATCTAPDRMSGYCLAKKVIQHNSTTPRCDFTANSCTAGLTCKTAGGCPKYGDYNGLAVGGGTLVNIWASGQPIAGQSPPRPRAYAVVTKLPVPAATP